MPLKNDTACKSEFRIKSSEEAATEALYFFLYRSYLLQKSDARSYYEMLKNQYKKYPESFKILTKNDLFRLGQVQDDIKNNRFSLFSGPLDMDDSVSEALKREKSDKKHSDLCIAIAEDRKFRNRIGPIDFVSLEHPVMFGSIDILFQSRKTAYIIEVKTDNADHAIIGQVRKYFIGLSLKLILRLFDEIKIITLCPGYDRASLTGLRQIGAKPLLIDTNTLEVKEI